MSLSPKQNEDKMTRFVAAWKQFAPDKSFGGMTLAQFESIIAPSLDTRAQIETVSAQLQGLQLNRDQADAVSMARCNLVANGVKGDPTEGPNSDLWKAMGFVPDDERQSGLTRKKKVPTPPVV